MSKRYRRLVAFEIQWEARVKFHVFKAIFTTFSYASITSYSKHHLSASPYPSPLLFLPSSASDSSALSTPSKHLQTQCHMPYPTPTHPSPTFTNSHHSRDACHTRPPCSPSSGRRSLVSSPSPLSSPSPSPSFPRVLVLAPSPLELCPCFPHPAAEALTFA